MEAKALGISLDWVHYIGLPLEFIETDALVVVNGLKNNSGLSTQFGDLITYASNLLSFFPKAQVSHVYCGSNKTAHGLTQ